ncbi:MAG: Asp-tRNA(Asn)/Glu-tRNA(Gln) amidotransferase subunit GatB [Patescibacteria group bacterium]|nr:Asp-tRNA(Asn)/Glu-tRNA(Gln) amidotransferase subunit GatB [Patescibacteria group bacterium]
MKLEPVIGLEIHVQLKTKSKMFCGCDNAGENQPANTTICPICTGQPGTLPVINETAYRWGLKTAIALNCLIPEKTKFDRKNYFYPDLPKGYQISQYDLPIGQNGFYTIVAGDKKIKVGIVRVHLEEDSAKLYHSPAGDYSLVDFNRSGTPLLEIVTEPDFRSPAEAKAFLQELRLLMMYLKISDAEMEKGHLRCDANISLRPAGDVKLYTKTEIKNLNSFRSVERALAYEVKRQTKLWDENKVSNFQSTRGWNEQKGVTVEQRSKEGESDYRYFPEPDLPPFVITKKEITKLKAAIPELPNNRRERFKQDYDLSQKEIDFLITNEDYSDYLEGVISELEAWFVAERPKERGREFITQKKKIIHLAASWLINRLTKLIYDEKLSLKQVKITQENFAEFIKLIFQSKVNSLNAQEVLKIMFKTGGDPSDIVERKNLGQIGTSEELERIIEKVIKDNPLPVQQYRSGKTQTLQFLIGQVMKQTKGRADPNIVNGLIVSKLR